MIIRRIGCRSCEKRPFSKLGDDSTKNHQLQTPNIKQAPMTKKPNVQTAQHLNTSGFICIDPFELTPSISDLKFEGWNLFGI